MAIAYNAKTVTDGLVLYLDAANRKSYPGTGTTVTNIISGNQYTNASLFGDISYGSITNGVINIGGIGVSSSTACIIQGVGDLASTINGDFTSIGWIYRTSSDSGEILSYRYSGQRCAFDVDNTTMTFYQRETTGTFVTRFTSVSISNNLNTWYCYGLVRSGNNWSFYRNGALIGTTSFTLSETITTPSALYTIGGAWTDDDFLSNCMDGSVGPVMHYARALSASEIQQNFEATRGRYGI